jgi:hypothetical protein
MDFGWKVGLMEQVRRLKRLKADMLSFSFRVKKVSDTNSLLIPCSSEGAHSTEFEGSRSG